MIRLVKEVFTMKNKMSFILTFISVVGCLLLAWFKNVNIEIMLPSILAIYIIGRTTAAASNVWAASRDPSADTIKAIERYNEKE
jgi:hypothetical protein